MRPAESADPQTGLRTVRGYCPGLLARIVGAHMDYYAPAWGFGAPFETKVAAELSAFLCRYDPQRDFLESRFDAAGALAGSLTIDGIAGDDPETGAHLRWFITAPAVRGTGVGRSLMRRAMAFCDGHGYRRVVLTTFAGLDAARHLYESHGFHLIREVPVDQWGGGVREQHFTRVRDGRK